MPLVAIAEPISPTRPDKARASTSGAAFGVALEDARPAGAASGVTSAASTAVRAGASATLPALSTRGASNPSDAQIPLAGAAPDLPTLTSTERNSGFAGAAASGPSSATVASDADLRPSSAKGAGRPDANQTAAAAAPGAAAADATTVMSAPASATPSDVATLAIAAAADPAAGTAEPPGGRGAGTGSSQTTAPTGRTQAGTISGSARQDIARSTRQDAAEPGSSGASASAGPQSATTGMSLGQPVAGAPQAAAGNPPAVATRDQPVAAVPAGAASLGRHSAALATLDDQVAAAQTASEQSAPALAGPDLVAPASAITAPSMAATPAPLPAAAPPSQPGPATTLSLASPAAQVAQTAPVLIAMHADAGAQNLMLRLTPAELGTVQIQVARNNDGTAAVSVLVERPETLRLLLHDQAQLQHALTQAGLPQDRTLEFQQAPAGSFTAQDSRSSSTQDGAGQDNGRSSQQQQQDLPGSTTRPAQSGRSSPYAPAWQSAGIDITA